MQRQSSIAWRQQRQIPKFDYFGSISAFDCASQALSTDPLLVNGLQVGGTYRERSKGFLRTMAHVIFTTILPHWT